MSMHKVKLVNNVVEKAGGHAGVSFLESEERYSNRVDNGWVLVDRREFALLRAHNLIDEAIEEAPAQVNPGDEDKEGYTRARSQVGERGEPRPTAVHPGGAGHLPDDAYGNAQIQREIQRDEQRGIALRQSRGLPSMRDAIPEESRRSDHALPEQVKEQERLVRERDKAHEKDRKAAAKEQRQGEGERQEQSTEAHQAAEPQPKDERSAVERRSAEAHQDRASREQEKAAREQERASKAQGRASEEQKQASKDQRAARGRTGAVRDDSAKKE